MIKAVLFDYDGTLTNRYESAYRMYKHIIKEVLPVETDSLELECIVQRCMLLDEFGNVSKSHVFNTIKEEYIPSFDADYWKNYWSRHFCDYQVPAEGCFDLLKKLSLHYKLGVISNGDGPSQNAKITALGIRKYFEAVVVCGDYGIQKPDPRIYRIAAEKLSLNCDEIAFVGDTFMTDIAGAIRAGMYPVWICSEHKGVSDYDVRKIERLDEVADIFIPGI